MTYSVRRMEILNAIYQFLLSTRRILFATAIATVIIQHLDGLADARVRHRRDIRSRTPVCAWYLRCKRAPSFGCQNGLM